VFLLLTFFVFTMVLMVRADVLDVNLPEIGSGRSAESVIPITIAISDTGAIFVNSEAVDMDGVVERVEALRQEFGDGALVLAVDTDSPAGVMIGLADVLTGAGLGEFSIIGHRQPEGDSGMEDVIPTP
jgi:biopolymer transport protein ExbD